MRELKRGSLKKNYLATSREISKFKIFIVLALLFITFTQVFVCSYQFHIT